MSSIRYWDSRHRLSIERNSTSCPLREMALAEVHSRRERGSVTGSTRRSSSRGALASRSLNRFNSDIYLAYNQ